MAEQTAEVARRCQEAKETLRLELGGCDLRKFPDAVFFLMKDVELQSLSLAGNSLSKIPNKLSQKLTTITSLDLSRNQLSSLPDNLSHLHQLTHLSVSHNELQELPQGIASLPALQTLEVGSNRICHISTAELDRLPALQRLVVTGNPLTEESKISLVGQGRVEVVLEEER